MKANRSELSPTLLVFIHSTPAMHDDENYDWASGAPFIVAGARVLDDWPNVLTEGRNAG